MSDTVGAASEPRTAPSTRPSPAPGPRVGDDWVIFGRQNLRTGPTPAVAVGQRAGFTVLVHAICLLLVGLVVRYVPAGVMKSSPMEAIPFHDIVWLNKPGPGGGGGGGGNRMQAPPGRAQAPGRDKITVPVAKPETYSPTPQVAKELPPPGITIPAKSMGDSNFTVPGAMEGGDPSLSHGPGSGGGYGTGTGTGIGPGNGSGLGPGWGGGYGGGAYRPGSGVSLPEVVREVKPLYTADAMRQKIQGVAIVECIVLPDGTVGDAHIVKSLDPLYGLDQEALKAARQWRFRPARRQGQPVAIIISIELTFNLR